MISKDKEKQFEQNSKLNAMIIRNPKILNGKPIIKGTRISVELIMRKFAGGYTIEQILSNYPHLTVDQIKSCFEYSANLIADEQIVELA